MMTLPFQIDPDAVDAVIKNSILTVTIPKPHEAVETVKKITVEHAK